MTTRRRGNREGSLGQRADGRWEARIRLEGGGRKSVYGATRDECRRKLRAVLREIEDAGRPSDDKLTFGKYATRWLGTLTLRDRTKRRYEGIVRLHLIPRLGKVTLSKIRADDIDSLLAAKLAEGLSPQSVEHIRAVIGRVLSVAEKKDVIHVNPARKVDPVEVPDRKVRATTPEEAWAIIHAVQEDRSGAIFILALATGLREGELLALQWRDIDLDEGRLRVTRTLGLGRDAKGEPKFDPPKTRRSNRTVRIPPFARPALREHRKRQLEERVLAGDRWHDHGLVFTNSIGQPRDPSEVLRTFQKLLARAGIERMRVHDLRHAAATLMIAAGEDLSMVKDVLGHSTIALTSDTYAHILDRGREAAADRYDDYMSQTGS